jgi:transposase
MDKRWAQAPAPRDQQVLFADTLDGIVPAEHPIRALNAILDAFDWLEWEKRYDGYRGQPPIHPRLMAGCILYGLIRGIRSSRELEDATRERVDYRWFLEGREIDHSTFARFRTAFEAPLKQLNRQIAKMICERYDEALICLVLDGTRVRANSDRHGARTAETLERLINACAHALNQKLERLAQTDAAGDTNAEEVAGLRKQVAQLQAKVKQYEGALAHAKQRDAHKQQRDGKKAIAVRVPVTDPESYIQPNKEGGYAPNYTPVVAADAASGAIIYEDVSPGADESSSALPAVAQAHSMGGAYPQRVLADGRVLSGETMHELEALGIAVHMPTETDFSTDNPANRADPTQPVPEGQWAQLPRRAGILSRSAFVYDPAHNCYYCPMGQALQRASAGKHYQTGVEHQEYKCAGKAGCPLAKECVNERAAARTIVRDKYQDIRDTVGRRMATEEGHAAYKQRAPAVEGVFARIKHHMKIRAFLLRGLGKVRTEWCWVCTGYNLKLLMRIASQGVKISTKRPWKPQKWVHGLLQDAWLARSRRFWRYPMAFERAA